MKIFNLYRLLFTLCFSFIALHSYSQEIEKTIFITSNTGNSESLKTLKQIVNDAQSKNDAILLLLGNVAPKEGYNSIAEKYITKQLSVINQFDGKIIVTPGNNEWKIGGHKGVDKLEKFIQNNSKAKFYPNDGCPIKKKNITDNIVLFVIDSQWYLEDWDKYPYINNDCDIKNRTEFYLELDSQLKKAEGKIKIISVHHPVVTNTKIGLLHKTGGVLLQDFQNKQYRNLRNRLTTLARQSEDVIFVSGHDKNLQLIDYYGLPQIISGSSGKTKNANPKKEGDFAASKIGYARLDIYKNGEASVAFLEVSGSVSKQLFAKKIITKKEIKKDFSFKAKSSFNAVEYASVYSKDETTKSKFYKSLWGEHYREYYSKTVGAPVAFLDTLMGGLTPIRRGGGHQSKSLRLEDKNGKQFVMRALRKSAVRFLQSTAFQDKYVEEKLKGTSVDRLLLDFYTTAHPYTPFVAGSLSEAVGIFHTNPKLYYIPKQEVLGEFNDTYGDELYMIEERVESNHSDLESFGKPEDIISTDDLLKEIVKKGKSYVDEPSYIRARLFDMLTGDWDRHEDQWRWGLFRNPDGSKIYKPIPRDRDQIFSTYDGLLISFLKFAIPDLRMFQSFNPELKDVKWFNIEPYPLDLTFINNSNWDEWEKQSKYLQENLTDKVITQAFEKIPSEMKGKTINKIKEKLKGRRSEIVNIARRYYEYLNRVEIITGTQKSDIFHIKRMASGKTEISVKSKNISILNKTFSSEITKEIWIYGLDGKDIFTVSGKGDKLIKIRIVGGKKNDTYDFKNIHKVKLYDYKSKKNTIVNKKSKKWLVDSYEINNYNYKKKKYSKNQLFPVIGANPDDGFKIGFLNTLTNYGLQRNTFTSQYKFGATYYFGNSGYDLTFSSEYSNIFNKWNFGIEGWYTSPNFAINYFGDGNETLYDKDVEDLDFNRVRIRKWGTAISLIWRGRDGGYFHFKPLFESFDVENTEGRFINILPENSTVFERQNYIGTEVSYQFKNKNSRAFPTLGMDLGLTLGYKTSVDGNSNDNSFTYVKSHLAFDYGLNSKGNLVLATRIGGEAILSDNFEFYHAATLGGKYSLRGFRNQRFNGKSSLYQNTDLRLSLGKSKASFLPFKYGFTAGFDFGRVWEDNDNSNKWHNSYGGSFWISGLEALNLNLGYYNSTDGGRVVFSLGFDF